METAWTSKENVFTMFATVDVLIRHPAALIDGSLVLNELRPFLKLSTIEGDKTVYDQQSKRNFVNKYAKKSQEKSCSRRLHIV